jgi:hypothetical protein
VHAARVIAAWHHFVPAGARAVVADLDGPPLVSGQLLSRHADVIAVPVIEVTATRAAHLVGVLRACRQARALVVVAVTADVHRRSPDAGQRALRGVAAAAAAAHHDLSIVMVARAYRGRNAPADDVALLLVEIDDRGLPVSAVRGASPFDETGRASRVVEIGDLAQVRGLDRGGLRVNIDAIVTAIDSSDDEVEARAWLRTSRTLRALQAEGTADRLARTLEVGGSS